MEMQNIIITESCSNLRGMGRQVLAGKWQLAIIAVLIYEACISLPSLILSQFFGKTLVEFFGNLAWGYDGLFSSVLESARFNSMHMSNLSGLYVFLVSGALMFGLTTFFLSLSRMQKTDNTQIFTGFNHYLKTLGLLFMVALFVFLWSLLLVVPGIIAALRYSQSFYILADDPSKDVMQCINESKYLMQGNKGKLFLLDLSFIGWGFLTGLVIGVITGFVYAFTGPSFMYALFNWIINLAMCWLWAYIYATNAVFYNGLIQNSQVRNV